MPELPEVETIKNDLQRRLPCLIIEDAIVYDDRVIQGLNQAKFCSTIKGRQFKQIDRRAKAIVIHFTNGGFLVVHLKMTGQLVLGENLKTSQNTKETKVVFRLSNGMFLNYNDQRLFGRLILTDDLTKIPYLQQAGPEPLNGGFNADWLERNLGRKNTPIKNLLLDQHFVAGIGNIYASEILFASRIDPQRKALKLKKNEIKELYRCTVKILREAIRLRGTSMRNYRDSAGEKGNFKNRIKVYGRDNEPCVICRGPIARIVQAQRSTFYCPRCQK